MPAINYWPSLSRRYGSREFKVQLRGSKNHMHVEMNLIGEDGYLELWARMHLLSEAVNAGCMKKLKGYYPELDQYYEVGRAGIKREQQCAA